MKRIPFVLTALLLLVAVPLLGGHGAEPKEVSDLMKKKLGHAQKVLEGVAVKDFDKITKHAEELILISNEAEWKVLKTPRYEIYSNDFRRNAEALIKNAKDKSLDAAALSYVDLTLTCVKCHKHVREVRMTRADPRRE
jgi:hypothetical protein